MLGAIETTGDHSGPVLVLVHGTGDTKGLEAEPEIAERWWQATSQFEKWLCARLQTPAGEPLSSKLIVRFVWSGLNSETARDQAAHDLLNLLQDHAARGKSLHILAHSHGGNVTRRALEIAEARRSIASDKVRRVICFGTPFFHYRNSSVLISATILGGLACLGGYLTWFALEIFRPWFPGGAGFVQIILLCLTLHYGFKSAARVARMPLWRRSSTDDLAAKEVLTNYVTSRDEALGLLRSFDRPLQLMRLRPPDRWASGPLGTVAFGMVCVVVLAFLIFVAGGYIGTSSEEDFYALLTLCLQIVGIAVAATTLHRLFDTLLDVAITSRLKAVALGDDFGNGISTVEEYPWAGAEAGAIRLPAEIDGAIEERVLTASANLLPAIRGGMAAGAPLLSGNVAEGVRQALTGSELAHTLYYEVEAFAELIAGELVGTGEWIKRENVTSSKLSSA